MQGTLPPSFNLAYNGSSISLPCRSNTTCMHRARRIESMSTPPKRLRSVKDALTGTPSPKRARLRLVSCPICSHRVPYHTINLHLDRCKVPSNPVLHLSLSVAPLQATILRLSQPPSIPADHFSEKVRLRNAVRDTKSVHMSAPMLNSITLPPIQPHLVSHKISISLLKSALQKCVRRKRPFPAARLALVLMRRLGSCFELLRRFTIIVLEDAILHPNFALLVAIMCLSSKGYQPDRSAILLILQTVFQVAAAPFSDTELANSTRTDSLPIQSLSEPYRTLVTSIYVRACYGGMSFDTDLLARAATLWMARFQDAAFRETFKSFYLEESAITDALMQQWLDADDPLAIGDVPLEALDFHCCPIVDWFMTESGEGRIQTPLLNEYAKHADKKKCVQSLMWKYRSGVSYKRDFQNDEDEPANPQESPVKNVATNEDKGDIKNDEPVNVEESAAEKDKKLDDDEKRIWCEELLKPFTEWSVQFRRRFLTTPR